MLHSAWPVKDGKNHFYLLLSMIAFGIFIASPPFSHNPFLSLLFVQPTIFPYTSKCALGLLWPILTYFHNIQAQTLKIYQRPFDRRYHQSMALPCQPQQCYCNSDYIWHSIPHNYPKAAVEISSLYLYFWMSYGPSHRHTDTFFYNTEAGCKFKYSLL